jgi:hypothetical protein
MSLENRAYSAYINGLTSFVVAAKVKLLLSGGRNHLSLVLIVKRRKHIVTQIPSLHT